MVRVQALDVAVEHAGGRVTLLAAVVLRPPDTHVSTLSRDCSTAETIYRSRGTAGGRTNR